MELMDQLVLEAQLVIRVLLAHKVTVLLDQLVLEAQLVILALLALLVLQAVHGVVVRLLVT